MHMEERQGNKRLPLSVFYSYAHEDEPLRKQLTSHLSLLRRQGLISEWHDRQLLPGTQWEKGIDAHLETASVILLLISSDFIESDYCYEIEMQRALERHQQGKATVIPIIMRPCKWQGSPFAHLQCLPPNGTPVTLWKHQDEAFVAIEEGLRRVIDEVRLKQTPLASPLPIPPKPSIPTHQQTAGSPGPFQQAARLPQ